MFVILKSVAGCVYRIGGREIELKGGCYANSVSDSDFKAICDFYPSFKRAIDEGFIVVNDSEIQKAVSVAVDETLQADLDKQTQAQENNAKRTNARVKRG